MPDIDKVVKGLYEIYAYFRDSVNAMRGGTADCTVFNGWAMTVTDALALLKEQTSVKPVKSKLSWEHGYNWDIWDCGHCGSQLRGDANYCDRCGHKVNWDDMEENDT